MNMPNMKDAKIRTKNKVETIYDSYKLTKDLMKIGENKTFYLRTYGCQMNEHDSEKIKAILTDLGFKEILVMEKADLILFNTCAIRENVHNKVFGLLGRVKHLREVRPEVITGICGCMTQEESVVNFIKEKYKWVDFVFGTHNIQNIPQILEKAISNKKTEIEVFSKEGEIIENLPIKRDSKYKAWVDIMYGCDKFCTYCIVPFTRGKQRSRKFEDIINEVKELKKEGYKEITLLGQNVNAYGKDLEDEKSTMANLLKEVALIDIPRVRFVTSHPWDFTDEMINIMKNNSNIMPYIHLPLQSGSNKILKLMGRRYTKEDYLNLFNKLKKEIPNCSITTDIIVGFPNETREDFEETLDVVKKCKYDSAYTFIFSKRKGTPAAKMKDEILLEEKKVRLQELNKYVNKHALENNEKYLNKKVKVLLEKESSKNKEVLRGYTETMKLVNVKAPKKLLGQIVNIKINDIKTFNLEGILIDE